MSTIKLALGKNYSIKIKLYILMNKGKMSDRKKHTKLWVIKKWYQVTDFTQ